MRLSLKTIPTDALTPILDLLDGYALFRLVMCGDGSLNNTLGRAVERFDLEYKLTTRAPENWIWPRFVSRFSRLAYFRLTGPSFCVVRDLICVTLRRNCATWS